MFNLLSQKNKKPLQTAGTKLLFRGTTHISEKPDSLIANDGRTPTPTTHQGLHRRSSETKVRIILLPQRLSADDRCSLRAIYELLDFFTAFTIQYTNILPYFFCHFKKLRR